MHCLSLELQPRNLGGLGGHPSSSPSVRRASMSAGRSLRTVSLLSTVISFTGVTGGDSIAAAIARSTALRTLSSRTRVLLLRAFSIPTHILTLSASSALALRAVSTPAISLSCSSLLSLLSALTVSVCVLTCQSHVSCPGQVASSTQRPPRPPHVRPRHRVPGHRRRCCRRRRCLVAEGSRSSPCDRASP